MSGFSSILREYLEDGGNNGNVVSNLTVYQTIKHA